MENQYQHTVNGQSVLQADLNAMGETAALADDRVLAELLRTTPYDGTTIARGILPYAHDKSGTGALVAPNGATGNVKVNPFRAIIGSRTAVATDAKKNWRDIRSAIAVGSTTLHQTASFAANASGNPRWDLVYAAVTVDATTASVTRKVKNPTTKAITGQSLVTQIATTVALGVQAGTAAASPSPPAIPADAGGTYYIPIAYVRIPNGFGASSTVLTTDIGTIAPVLAPSRGSGAKSLRVASTNSNLTTAQWQAWGSSGTRPKIFIPSSLSGSETLLINLNLSNASSANWSHQSGGLIDNSRDWRGRLTKFMVSVSQSSGFDESAKELSGGYVVDDYSVATNASIVGFGFGQTIDNGGFGLGHPVAAFAAGNKYLGMDDATNVHIRCNSSTGFLELVATGTPDVSLLFWIEFTAPFENA